MRLIGMWEMGWMTAWHSLFKHLDVSGVLIKISCQVPVRWWLVI